MQKEIALTLTPDEINLILESLGQQPFVRVFQLISKIQEQAAKQLSAENEQSVPVKRQ
jgi:hypothetical protein